MWKPKPSLVEQPDRAILVFPGRVAWRWWVAAGLTLGAVVMAGLSALWVGASIGTQPFEPELMMIAMLWLSGPVLLTAMMLSCVAGLIRGRPIRLEIHPAWVCLDGERVELADLERLEVRDGRLAAGQWTSRPLLDPAAAEARLEPIRQRLALAEAPVEHEARLHAREALAEVLAQPRR